MMISRRLFDLNNIYVYGVTLALPLAFLHLSTAYFIADVDLNSFSIIFPSLAVLSLVLELGISQFIVASKISIRKITIYFFSSAVFQYCYFILVCSVFYLSGFVIEEPAYYTLEVFLSFIFYAYSGFLISISRGIVDRARRRDVAIILRIITNIGVTGAIIIAYLGYDATLSFSFCAFTRLCVAVPILYRRFLNSNTRKENLERGMQISLNWTLFKLSASGITAFTVTGLLSRSIWLLLAAPSAFTMYVVAAEFCARISGFFLNAVQPFFHIIVKRIIWFDVLSLLAAIMALIFYEDRLLSILALSILLVTTGLKLQVFLIYERHLLRIAFPFLELISITVAFLLFSEIRQTDLQLLNAWVIGQLFCSFVCSTYLIYLRRGYGI